MPTQPHEATLMGESPASSNSPLPFYRMDKLAYHGDRTVLHPFHCFDEPSAIMPRKGSAFAGLSVALVTPFKNGQVDYPTLRAQVDFQIAAGTACLCPVGTTGESPTLSHEEHERVISEVVQAAAGRAKVMPGTGSNSTAEALRLTKWAAKEGADAALMVAPYYNKPTQEGFFLHYKAVAESVDIPICVYNIPGRTGKNIEPETIARLAQIPNITMVKEATGQLDQASHILSSTDLTVLSGDDSLTLPIMSVGGEGVISVVGNIVPQDMIALVSAYRKGEAERACELHHKLFPLCRDMLGLATNPIPIKAAMKLLGRDTGDLRLPMTPLDEKGIAALRKTLTHYGLL
jgi:4-hydroxy-tetrahydrodipicolinate synthase